MPSFSELRRRNVFKVAYVYVIAAALMQWLIVVVRAQAGLPGWIVYLTAAMLIIGLPVSLIFAWVYEITPTGLKKAVDVDQTQSIVFKTGQKLNASLAVLVVLAAVAMVANRMMPELVRPDLTTLEQILKRPSGEAIPEGALVAPVGDRVPAEIRSFTLGNGLKFIVWPDESGGDVVMYVVARVGSRNEYSGITGASQFMKRLLFNSSANLPPGDFQRWMTAAGAVSDARSTADLIAFRDEFPAEALDTVFALEADRLSSFVIDADILASIRSGVSTERERVDRFDLLDRHVRATAYIAHPYQVPVYGWPSDIANLGTAQLETFFRNYFGPANCVVVVAGNVEPEAIYRLARTYFGSVPSRPPAPTVNTVEPEQPGERRVVLPGRTGLPLLQLAVHVGGANNPETLPAKLLLEALAGDASSPLYELLVTDEEIAMDIEWSVDEGFDPGLANITVTLAPEADADEVINHIFDVFNDVAINGVGDDLLARARDALLAEHDAQLADIDGKASMAAAYDALTGNFERLFTFGPRLQNVTADDVRNVADQYFRRGDATIGLLLPEAPAEP